MAGRIFAISLALSLAGAAALVGDGDEQAQKGEPMPYDEYKKMQIQSHEHSGCREGPIVREGRVETRSHMWHEGTLTPMNRTYHVYVPNGYVPSEETPVVLRFHEWGAGALSDSAEWHNVADKFNMIVVSPEGFDDCQGGACLSSAGGKSWNAGGATTEKGKEKCGARAVAKPSCYASCANKKGACHPCDMAHCYDDVASLKQLVSRVRQQYCVDRTRVFAVGSGNGGVMAYDLAGKASEMIAAVVTNSRPMAGRERLTHAPQPGMHSEPGVQVGTPFSMMYFGKEGDQSGTWLHGVAAYKVAPEIDMLSQVKAHNGCKNAHNRVKESLYSTKTGIRCGTLGYNCEEGTEVTACHHEQGEDAPEGAPINPRLAVEFLLDHPRSARL